MTSFWKSQDRKWCDFCKCWFADNKISIDFHENGKRHKEAVAQRIKDSRKRGMEEAEEKREASEMLKQIERDAVASMKADIASDESLAAHYNRRLPPGRPMAPAGSSGGAAASAQQLLELAATARQRRDMHGAARTHVALGQAPGPGGPAAALPGDVWAEMETENGHVYFYNTRTGESSWTNPTAPPAAAGDGSAREEESDEEPAKGGWFNDDAKADEPPPPPPPKGARGGGGPAGRGGDDYALGTIDRSGAGPGGAARTAAAAVAPKAVVLKDGAASGASTDGGGGSGGNGVGGWGTVEKQGGAAAADATSEPKVDAITGVDGREAAVTFTTKATPSLKRPAGAKAPAGGIKMKKRKGNANMRGRVKKPA